MKWLINFIYHLFLTIFILYKFPNIYAIENYFLFHKLTLEHGISNNSITSIYKDSRGFIWIGTIDGLNRYDGHTFLIYRHDVNDSNSISDNFISTIVEDNEGNLWIGTQGGGLNCYNPYLNSFKNFFHNPRENNSLPSDFIFHHQSMIVDRRGILWIGTNNGLCSYNSKKRTFIRYKLFFQETHEEPSDIRAILETSDGTFWIGTNKGLYQFDPQRKKIIRYFNTRTYAHLTNNIVTALAENTLNNTLWVGTEEGLNVISLSSFNIIHYFAEKNTPNSLTDNSITAIDIDRKGNVWIGTKSGGLNQYNLSCQCFYSWKQNPSDRNSLSDNYIETLHIDPEGYLWIGTINNGVNLVDISPKKFTWLKNEPGNPNSLSNNTIRSVYEDDEGILWIGTYGGGLNRYDGKNFKHFSHQPARMNSLSHNIISALFKTKKDLWIGTWGGGLCRLNTKSFDLYRIQTTGIPDYINQITCDSRNRIWLACNGGLFIFSPTNLQVHRIDHDSIRERKLTANSINRILWTQNHLLWIATFDGLNCIVFKDFEKLIIDTIYHFRKQNYLQKGLVENRILTLEEDLRKNLYLGTYTGGMIRVNVKWNNKRIAHIEFMPLTDANGLAGNIIYGILSDKTGNLWISTNNGLSKYNPLDNTFQNYTMDDGLQSNQFYWNAYYKGKNSKMYFGGINGLNIFYPDSIFIERNFPKVYITNFQLFNQTVKVTNDKNSILKQSILFTPHITLKRNDYPFTIEFAALVYRSQNKLRYAYQLENFDKTWIYTDASRRYATYSHLRPGNYTFKVKTTNVDGVWNENITQLKITILPAFYETFWAFFIYGFILIVLLYFFRQQILARARYRHEIQLQRLERQKSEEYNELKLQFFTNISHEFRTPLTLILGPLQKILSRNDLKEEIKNQLLLIHSGSKRLLHLINQILEFRKVESGNYELKVHKRNIIPILKEIVELFKSKAQSSTIQYSAFFPLKNVSLIIDENVLETIAFNLLSNAFKFTPYGGTICFEVDFLNENKEKTLIENDIFYLVLRVSDTGKGIPAEKLEHIFKRYYQVLTPSNVFTKGTGIGLTLCKELSNLHGGNIEVVSEENKGSVFTAFLAVHPTYFIKNNIPIHTTHEEYQNILWEEIADQTLNFYPDTMILQFNTPEDPNAPSVLIIEDDIEIIQFIGKLIELKYHVLYAFNGKDGLRRILEYEPDIVISDVMMPEMSGFEVCERLKTDPRLSHIPIILLTALSHVDDKIKGFHYGADDYITKPFDERHLLIRLEKLLQQRQNLRKHFQHKMHVTANLPTLTPLDQKLLEKIIELVEKNLSNPELTVEDLSVAIGLSSTHLYRKIKALTGLSTNDFIRKMRLQRAAQLLLAGQGNISQVMYEVGFTNSSYFAKRFQEEYGMTPREFLMNNKKENK